MRRMRGFTLIELLVVIAIIGILAALSFTLFGSTRVKARNGVVRSDITQMGKAVEVYLADEGAVLASSSSGVSISSNTTNSVPTAWPFTKNGTYGQEFIKTPAKTSGTDYTYVYRTDSSATKYKVCGSILSETGPVALSKVFVSSGGATSEVNPTGTNTVLANCTLQ
jgi:prepilin-type N-terminal cleavage/methylation domain-containing protein